MKYPCVSNTHRHEWMRKHTQTTIQNTLPQWWLWNKSHLHTHKHAGPPVVLGRRCAETAMRLLRAQRADLEVNPQNVAKWFGNVRMRRREGSQATWKGQKTQADWATEHRQNFKSVWFFKSVHVQRQAYMLVFGLVWLKSFRISLGPFITLSVVCVCLSKLMVVYI